MRNLCTHYKNLIIYSIIGTKLALYFRYEVTGSLGSSTLTFSGDQSQNILNHFGKITSVTSSSGVTIPVITSTVSVSFVFSYSIIN